MASINNLSDIITGDIVLVSSSGFLPKAIQWFQGNKYNHAGMLIWLWGELFVCESVAKGIVLTKWNDFYKKKNKYIFLRYIGYMGEDRQRSLASFMLSKCGNVGYDFVNLLFYQPIKYFWEKIFGKKIWIGTNQDKGKKRFMCGEWCAYCYNYLDELFKEDWHMLAPVDLYRSGYFEHHEIEF